MLHTNLSEIEWEQDRREREEAHETDRLLESKFNDARRAYCKFLQEKLDTAEKRREFVIEILEYYNPKSTDEQPHENHAPLYFTRSSSGERSRVIPDVPALIRDLLERYADFDKDDLMRVAVTNGRQDCARVIKENIDRLKPKEKIEEDNVSVRSSGKADTDCSVANFMFLFGGGRRNKKRQDNREPAAAHRSSFCNVMHCK